ncbi:winged helix-turn-helix domain-containing protein [Vibrio alginolyticus]|uniref:winged helix-turn-helix domain-containing protein n=1 Tax=Vibrio chagasii TaxID=170679 RepID=UPI001EFEB7E6|nr:winged helix-turn-helix domain-containing protein [Vibrio chagasii]MCG9604123.1 winged helix-turn-helix domain-containing protein [Vibrio chagasii]MDE9380592.1 winged helix-turn-helix domain-containing protein [Vibrio alginolyticus]
MNNNKLQEYDLVIEFDDRTVINPSLNKVVTLSPSECLLLKHLMDNCSQTLGREFLLTHCWPGRIVTNSSLNVAIKNVRTALKEVGSDCKVITVQKEGYCFVAPENSTVPDSFVASDSSVVSEGFIGSEKSAASEHFAEQDKDISKSASLGDKEDSTRSEFTVLESKSASDLNESADTHGLSENTQAQGKHASSKFMPLVSGLAVSLFIVIILSYLGLFMERASIKGVDVYHDNVELEPELVEDLTSLAKPGVEAIYLHRMGIECGGMQVVVLDESGWHDISANFKSRRCSQGQKEAEKVEGTADEA